MSKESQYPVGRSWRIPTVVVVIMIVLALVGVSLTTSRTAMAPRYWIALVPIYGILCVITAWDRRRRNPGLQKHGVFRQVFHWLAIAGALWLDFFIRGTGEETQAAEGMNALLLVALGCFLAGVHLEWLFAIVGALLAMALIMVAEAQQEIWLVFVVGGIVIAALIGFRWVFVKGKSPKAGTALPPAPSAPTGS